ncbi:MAG TPA: ABC transporter permease, partial [Acidimicrobiia bacterium]|nr:ABC transporter permease [Acidimicrobiia bacterium]
MSAVWMWVRDDVRRRWRSWVVLGVLAGVSVGLACAGIAGARRAARAVPTAVRVSTVPDAGILANDPAFDDAKRAQIAALPYVRESYPFLVPFLLQTDVPGLDGTLLSVAPQTMRVGVYLVAGRMPDPGRADEVIISEAMRDQLHMRIGGAFTLLQTPPADVSHAPFPVPPRVSVPIHQELHVVGISKSEDRELDYTPSSGFYQHYRRQLVGFTNEFVSLRDPARDLPRLQTDVDRIMGKPTNVADGADLFGTRQLRTVANVERNGLLLFALAVLVGAGALVGQALVRAVTAGAADLATWRALGADSPLARTALVLPAVIPAIVGAVTAVAVAILLSPRFPIALVRKYDIDVGFHADWIVLALGALGLLVIALAAAFVIAALRVRRAVDASGRAPLIARWVSLAALPASLFVGTRFATGAGRGHRSVPIRSAIVGAVVGVMGVVGGLTFRAGLADVAHEPQRSGVVWDLDVVGVGSLPSTALRSVARDPTVAAAVHATWARAVEINGTATPTFGTAAVKGDVPFVVLAGHAPRADDEIVIAPTTMKRLGLRIGDTARVGSQPVRVMHVVGRALLPTTSHTSYDQSAWMTAPALRSSIAPGAESSGDFTEDYLLVRWKPGADVAAAQARLEKLAGSDKAFDTLPAQLPPSVKVLGDLRVLPLALAVFFGLLAIATVAHALVTTVRRRRSDLAVLRSMGFTHRD